MHIAFAPPDREAGGNEGILLAMADCLTVLFTSTFVDATDAR